MSRAAAKHSSESSTPSTAKGDPVRSPLATRKAVRGMADPSSSTRRVAGGLAAATHDSAEFEQVREQLLERTVAAEPGSADWADDLTAAWGALPRVRQEAIRDRVDADLDELVRTAARQAVAALDALQLEASVEGTLALVAVEIRRRELEAQGVAVIVNHKSRDGGRHDTRTRT